MNIQFIRAEQMVAPESFKKGYCFDVLRDGVKIARWEPCGHRRGYWLVDLSGRIIQAPWIGRDGNRRHIDRPYVWRMVHCATQSEFKRQVLQELDYIPTLEQIAQRQRDVEAEKDRAAAEQAEKQRIERIKEAGPDLLEALQRLEKEGWLRYIFSRGQEVIGMDSELAADIAQTVADARSAIEKATGTALQYRNGRAIRTK